MYLNQDITFSVLWLFFVSVKREKVVLDTLLEGNNSQDDRKGNGYQHYLSQRDRQENVCLVQDKHSSTINCMVLHLSQFLFISVLMIWRVYIIFVRQPSKQTGRWASRHACQYTHTHTQQRDGEAANKVSELHAG